jgi:hypothetical protein
VRLLPPYGTIGRFDQGHRSFGIARSDHLRAAVGGALWAVAAGGPGGPPRATTAMLCLLPVPERVGAGMSAPV